MPPGASLTYLATDMWTQEARTCRQCKPKAQCHLVHSFSSPSSVRSHLFLSLSFSSILSFSAKYPTNKPSNLPWAEQGQQEHQCSTAVVQESKRASERQLVVHAQGRSLENQQWWNMFFFNDSKLMIFSSIHHAWFPWAYAKEKKTRDSSGCFNSSEMASPLQDSTGKEWIIPPFQTLTATLPFLRFRFLCFSFEIPPIQTGPYLLMPH